MQNRNIEINPLSADLQLTGKHLSFHQGGTKWRVTGLAMN